MKLKNRIQQQPEAGQGTVLSIIIVSYNTRELTCACIRSIYKSDMDVSFEVIVYDNASADGSAALIAAEFPEVAVIKSDTNIGFAAANNIAAEQACGDWLLLLNPDTEVLDNGIARLLDFAAGSGRRAIFGGASETPDGETDFRSCWAKPSLWGLTMQALGLSAVGKRLSVLNPDEMPDWQRDTTREVGVITGCFLMLNHSTWKELGGFDIDYFMYSEETDLCLRADQQGISRIFYPDARVLHIGGASETSKPHKTVKLFLGKRIYFEKHYSPFWSFYASTILDLHVLIRLLTLGSLQLFGDKFNEGYSHWKTVWRERGSWNETMGLFGRTVAYTLSPLEEQIHSCRIEDSFYADTSL